MNILFFLTPKSDVAYIEDSFSLRQILEKMEIHRYSAIPILSNTGEYVGTITEGDILWYCKRNSMNALKPQRASSLMIFQRNSSTPPYPSVPTWRIS